LPQREARANIGTGFPAMRAWECTLRFPQLFQKLGSQSLFKFSSLEPLEAVIDAADPERFLIYHEWSKYDLRFPRTPTDLVEANRAINEQLRERGFTVLGGQSNDGTGWSSWRNRTDDMLSALFPLDD
jgi:hypothetical protein